MRIWIIPKSHVEATTVRGGEFDGWWLPPQKDGRPDYRAIATGHVKGVWSQHIYHTAHVALTPAAAKKVRAALERGDSLCYDGGPAHASNYELYETTTTTDVCPHCHDGSKRIV